MKRHADQKDAKQLEYAAKQFTPLSLSFDLDRNNTPLWSSRPHNPMYVLPIFMHGKPNRSPNTPSHEARQFTPNEFRAPELKFQVSVKVKAAEDLWGRIQIYGLGIHSNRTGRFLMEKLSSF